MLKPSVLAYQEVEPWLVGTTMKSCGSISSGIWICATARSGNYRAWIVWDPDRTVSFSVPAQWNVDGIRDLSGGSHALGKATAVEIGCSPLLLVASGSQQPAPHRAVEAQFCACSSFITVTWDRAATVSAGSGKKK